MRAAVLALITTAALARVAVFSAQAQEPTQTTPTAASATATATSGTPAGTPTATVTMRPTPPPEPMPPTPGPPTPTPALPEEGGPPGGVLGGHVYVDNDGSRSYTLGDGVAGGEGVGVERLEGGVSVPGSLRAGAVIDQTGFWQVRALPDGVYRVMWRPSPTLPEDQWALTIPPMEPVRISEIETIYVMTQTVEIRGANRILDIDFGIPPQPPMVGAGGAPQLPTTGDGGGGSASMALLYAALGASVVLGLGGVVLRRRGRRA